MNREGTAEAKSESRELPRDDVSIESSLSAVDVAKHFSGVKALDGVSLDLATDEIVGLIGPNGSGKTTLLNIISGLLHPTSGHVDVRGVRMNGKPPHEFAREGIGRTFQQIRLFAGLTVEENLTIGALAKGVSTDIPELLDLMGLSENWDRDASTLPYGQQRRVEIARALAGRPCYLLLDEPAAGMNESESDELLAIVRRIPSDRKCGVLIVDHDLRLITRLCDRVHVLAEGHTISEGSPSVLRHDPAVIRAYVGTEVEQPDC